MQWDVKNESRRDQESRRPKRLASEMDFGRCDQPTSIRSAPIRNVPTHATRKMTRFQRAKFQPSPTFAIFMVLAPLPERCCPRRPCVALEPGLPQINGVQVKSDA